MIRRFVMIPAWVLAAAAAAPAAELFDGFATDWRRSWQERQLFTRPTQYHVIVEAGRRVLHASSRGAHSGLARRTAVEGPTRARLRWQWKVREPLQANRRERTRAGDDFAARVMVIFEESVVPLRTRVLNYVWAAHEPAGTVYPNPYSRNVAMCVVRTGPAGAGQWHTEERDLVADYRAFFGEPPRRISGVAVLVDTDNTGLEADAWFASLALVSTPPFEP